MASSSWIRCPRGINIPLVLLSLLLLAYVQLPNFLVKNNADVGHAQSHHAGTSEDQSWQK